MNKDLTVGKPSQVLWQMCIRDSVHPFFLRFWGKIRLRWGRIVV